MEVRVGRQMTSERYVSDEETRGKRSEEIKNERGKKEKMLQLLPETEQETGRQQDLRAVHWPC